VAISTVAPQLLTSGTACNGVYSGTFWGNVVVSSGQNCIFAGGGIIGSVLQIGGNLALLNSQVAGNLLTEGSSTFTVGPGTTISANLQVENLGASTAQNQICGALVKGNLQAVNNGTAVLIGTSTSCAGNTVHGILAVQNNSAPTSLVGNTVTAILQDQNNSAPTQVFHNRVGGILQCQNNTSITGGGNTARLKQGQCAAF
jgi:hypothetical protein